MDYLIKKENFQKQISILEIGPGVGVNIEVLQAYGKVDVLEIDEFFFRILSVESVELLLIITRLISSKLVFDHAKILSIVFCIIFSSLYAGIITVSILM